MAVYTHLEPTTLASLLADFEIGKLLDVAGVAAGSINTIYKVTTDRGTFFVRILEDRPARHAHFEAALLSHLRAHGLEVASPVLRHDGSAFVSLTSKQHLSVFPAMPGLELEHPELRPLHCAALGNYLARMHSATLNFKLRRKNSFDQAALLQMLKLCHQSKLRLPLSRLQEVIENFVEPQDLPRGIIHGDVFVDNAKFQGDKLVGLLDFEMASNGVFLYDLAVALLDWCFAREALDKPRATALLTAYQAERRLQKAELYGLKTYLEFVLARFTLTRIVSFELPQNRCDTRRHKDYRELLNRLDWLVRCKALPW